MKYFLLLLSALSFCLNAEESDYAKLNVFLAKMDELSASFVQHTFDGKGALLQTQKGRLKLKRPNQFRWESEQPYEQLLVSNGKTLWQYDADLEQVTMQPLNTKLSATPALLLSGNIAQVENEYDLYAEVLQDETHFVLIPKQVDALFDRLRLEFDAQKKLMRMVIQDEVGQKTIIRLADASFKKSISEQDFEFIVPKGVDVIRSE